MFHAMYLPEVLKGGEITTVIKPLTDDRIQDLRSQGWIMVGNYSTKSGAEIMLKISIDVFLKSIGVRNEKETVA